METICEQIYAEDFASLQGIIAAIKAGDISGAEERLLLAQESLRSIGNVPRKVQKQLFSTALQCRLEDQGSENLYLVPDKGRQIQAFNFMAEQFPVVSSAQALANAAHLARIATDKSFVILDIGIGTGQQILKLLKQGAEQGLGIERVCVVGIEPSKDSLTKAEAELKACADKMHIQFSFIGLQDSIESLKEDDWQHLETAIRSHDGPLLINASFALHHVQPISFRDELFSRLKQLSPAHMVIIEPYADYLSEDLDVRFQNAWHHYGLTFQAIDAIEAEEEIKNSVKEVFFGREMIDVLGKGDRVEQFETAEMWIDRFTKAGFAIQPFDSFEATQGNAVGIQGDGSTYIAFNVASHPIVAVIGAC